MFAKLFRDVNKLQKYLLQQRPEVEDELHNFDINEPQEELGCSYFFEDPGNGRLVKDVKDLSLKGSNIYVSLRLSNSHLDGGYYFQSNFGDIDKYLQCQKLREDKIPWTPLQYVCACDSVEMVKLLLNKGASLTIKDLAGNTALEIAQHLKRDKVVDILQNHKPLSKESMIRHAETSLRSMQNDLQGQILLCQQKDKKIQELERLCEEKELRNRELENTIKEKELQIQSLLSHNKCEFKSLCKRFVDSLELDPKYFKPLHDKCFCDKCKKSNLKSTVPRGDPPNSYALPFGWTRFGIQVHSAHEKDIWSDYHVSFHGTNVGAMKEILEVERLLLPGDKTSIGTEIEIPIHHIDSSQERQNLFTGKMENFNPVQFFTSPSIKYAEYYSTNFQFDGKYFKIVLQIRQKPNSYSIGQETVDKFKQWDPLFKNSELEWYSTKRNTHFVTGLLVRFQDLEK